MEGLTPTMNSYSTSEEDGGEGKDNEGAEGEG